MSLPTVAVFMFEVRGYSKLYDDVHYLQLGKRQISSLGFSVLYQKCLARQNWSMHYYDVHVISGVLFTKQYWFGIPFSARLGSSSFKLCFLCFNKGMMRHDGFNMTHEHSSGHIEVE